MSGKKDDIALLKQMENEAADTVRAAREGENARFAALGHFQRKAKMKLAAREAQVEIEEFKKERESWLRASIPQTDSLDAEQKAMQDKTDAEIGLLRREYTANRDEVIGMLMQVILNIDNPYTTVA